MPHQKKLTRSFYGQGSRSEIQKTEVSRPVSNGDGTSTYYSKYDLSIYDDQDVTPMQLTGLKVRLAEKNRAQVAQV